MKLFHSLILFSVLFWSGLQWQSRATWNYRDSHSTNRTVLCNSAVVCYIFVFNWLWQLGAGGGGELVWGEGGLGSNIKMMMTSYLEAGPVCVPQVKHGNIFSLTFITARKRSLRRLCFYTCLSVILFMGGSATVQAGIADPPWPHLPGSDPPGPDTPPGAHPPRSRLPQSRPPPEQTPPRAEPPPPEQTLPRSSASWEIRPTSGRYASYWNAYLFYNEISIQWSWN